jgi:hypothetical protein
MVHLHILRQQAHLRDLPTKHYLSEKDGWDAKTLQEFENNRTADGLRDIRHN